MFAEILGFPDWVVWTLAICTVAFIAIRIFDKGDTSPEISNEKIDISDCTRCGYAGTCTMDPTYCHGEQN